MYCFNVGMNDKFFSFIIIFYRDLFIIFYNFILSNYYRILYFV